MLVSTPKIMDQHGQIIKNSIAEIRKIRIGGVDQYLMIRGNNIDNPIILFIHGGPGQAEIGYIREYQKELEEKFIVVRWDQRGSGLSAIENLSKESLNTNTLISDTKEITDYLVKTFNHSKIFIAGHSWGTIVATNAVKNWPEKYLAYIGISQFIDGKEGEKISYDFTLLEAKKQNNEEVVEQLKKIGPPPYTGNDFLIRAQCLSMLGCVFKTNPNVDMGEALMKSTEYPGSIKSNYIKNALACSEILAPEILKVKFLKDIKEFKVPVYFIIGKHDYHTPTAMVEKFYNHLEAPKKELILFENSAHVPQLEENGKFNKTLLRIKREQLKRDRKA